MSKITGDSTNGVTIGVDMAHYAKLTTDKLGAAPVYEEPKSLPNTKTINITSNDSTQIEYYDNNPAVNAISKGEKNVAFTKSEFSNEEQVILFGLKKINGITVEGGESIPPYVAFGFRTLKSNKTYRYVWLLKGMFTMGDINNATREQATTFQNQTVNGVFIARQADGQIKIQADSDDANLPANTIKNWFKAETLNALYLEVEPEGEPEVEPES